MKPQETFRLGLSLPMFLASLLALFTGIFPGILGVWLWGAWRISVPEYIKTGHAHAAWWSVLILLAGILLPGLKLKPALRKFVIATSFLAVPLWMTALAAYYISKAARGVIAPLPATPGAEPNIEYLTYGTGIFAIEVWLFTALALVFLAAWGVKRLCQPGLIGSRLDLLTRIEVPRTIFRVPLIVAPLGILAGWVMTLGFKARGLAIEPAALVQLHSHTMFFVIGYLMTLLTMRAVGVKEGAFHLAYKLGSVAIPLIVAGWIAFNALALNSLVHVVPGVLYFLLLMVGFVGLLGGLGLTEPGSHHSGFVRCAMVYTWILMLALVAVGPIISLGWDVNANITVTYNQPQGLHYPGPYPEEYVGTAAVVHSPRGLENLHLSPGSWSHVALFWLLALLLTGKRIEQTLGRPGLIFLLATTIPLAPLFNAFARVAAWADLPAGIGGMWFAAHPLKFFNVLVLALMVIAVMRRLVQEEKAEMLEAEKAREAA